MTGYADWEGHVIVCGLHEVGLRIVDCRSTQMVGPAPPPTIVEAYRQNAGPGRNSDADMYSFQFLLTCRKS